MALKDTWKDLVDNVDDIEVKPINDIAHSVISNEENKLDKVTSNGSLRAYGVDNEGNQTVISTTTSGEGNALLLTDENGNSSVADPIEDIHIANKKFVDKENVKQNNIFANALKGKMSGVAVSMDDVSPVKHKVNVGLRSKNLIPYVADDTPITVKSCGKNLVHYPYYSTNRTVNGITFTNNGDGSVSVKGTASDGAIFNLYFNLIESLVPQGSTIVVSGGVGSSDTGDRVDIFVAKMKADGTRLNFLSSPLGTLTGRIEEGEKLVQINIWVRLGMTVDCTIYPQIEYGTEATAYEPYIEGETIETTLADGAQLENISPNMTITTDNSSVVIDTEYNKDSNIVIEKLTQAIIALGGNI